MENIVKRTNRSFSQTATYFEIAKLFRNKNNFELKVISKIVTISNQVMNSSLSKAFVSACMLTMSHWERKQTMDGRSSADVSIIPRERQRVVCSDVNSTLRDTMETAVSLTHQSHHVTYPHSTDRNVIWTISFWVRARLTR
jgi:hypothetical protein